MASLFTKFAWSLAMPVWRERVLVGQTIPNLTLNFLQKAQIRPRKAKDARRLCIIVERES